jgi:isopentenyl diphosphate isomerase/L-lactate dehydrogenase-like FMN-dependent dehydrogenase
MLQLIQTEMRVTMALTGCSRARDITPDLLVTQP